MENNNCLIKNENTICKCSICKNVLNACAKCNKNIVKECSGCYCHKGIHFCGINCVCDYLEIKNGEFENE